MEIFLFYDRNFLSPRPLLVLYCPNNMECLKTPPFVIILISAGDNSAQKVSSCVLSGFAFLKSKNHVCDHINWRFIYPWTCCEGCFEMSMFMWTLDTAAPCTQLAPDSHRAVMFIPLPSRAGHTCAAIPWPGHTCAGIPLPGHTCAESSAVCWSDCHLPQAKDELKSYVHILFL